MSAVPLLAPLSQARGRIHAAAMQLFAERGVTRVNISELAEAAGMARGTIYSHVTDIDSLFEEVAAELAHDMTARVVASFAGISDPARRLAIGVRQFIRRAHEEPLWGRFVSRFGLSDPTWQEVQATAPFADVVAGIESGRYRISRDQVPAMVSLIAGGTLAAMQPVLQGHCTWREIGADTAELMLVALGLSHKEARELARSELPPLLNMPRSRSHDPA